MYPCPFPPGQAESDLRRLCPAGASAEALPLGPPFSSSLVAHKRQPLELDGIFPTRTSHHSSWWPFSFFFFFFGCVGSLLLRTGFSLVVAIGGYSCSVQASHCSGFSCCRARALGVWASVVAARRLSSCSTWALEHAGFSTYSAWALGQPGFSSCDARA